MNPNNYQWLYVVDPMCSWCYAFAPEFNTLCEKYPFKVSYVMGGLAPDSTEPMPADMAKKISHYWHNIEAKTNVKFNHSFWQKNTPIRSTYPASRAVIASETMQSGLGKQMIEQIQLAYYQQAKNPALMETLVECANDIGLDAADFKSTMASCEVEEKLDLDFIIKEKLNVTGFPSLFLVSDKKAYPISHGFQYFNELVRVTERVLAKLTG